MSPPRRRDSSIIVVFFRASALSASYSARVLLSRMSAAEKGGQGGSGKRENINTRILTGRRRARRNALYKDYCSCGFRRKNRRETTQHAYMQGMRHKCVRTRVNAYIRVFRECVPSRLREKPRKHTGAGWTSSKLHHAVNYAGWPKIDVPKYVTRAMHSRGFLVLSRSRTHFRLVVSASRLVRSSSRLRWKLHAIVRASW